MRTVGPILILILNLIFVSNAFASSYCTMTLFGEYYPGDPKSYAYLDSVRSIERTLKGKRIIFDLQNRNIEILVDWKVSQLESISGKLLDFYADGVNIIYTLESKNGEPFKVILRNVDSYEQVERVRWVRI